MNLEKVKLTDIPDFRQMAEIYWQELMPHSDIVQSSEKQEIYFQDCSSWDGGNSHPFWAVAQGRRVGFVAYDVDEGKKTAVINDFYLIPEVRRQGHGSAMVKAIYAQFDALEVELVELNVRRDTPQALAFWEAQGFRIASYRLRQFRDSKTGTSYIGALSSDFA
ncbi:MAG: GNAT family N-acetyltransferase [Chloroflexi bacterium]|nr:GNAT family N-acetyltransferase [Chloroflexota bacterium]